MPVLDLELEWIRAQFPALEQKMDGQSVVFLDGPGGTQVPQSVIDAISDYLTSSNANLHGAFVTSARTDALVARAREAAADFLGCNSDEIVFGANMTTLTFAISRAIGRDLQPGDEILVTTLDHDANVAPWLALQERGVVVRTVDIHEADCTLDLADLERQLTERTKLVAITYASNAVGTINPVAKIRQLAHAVGALVFVDAVHYAPHASIDIQALDCDFLVCSAYKFFGPHLGILYGKHKHLSRLLPYKVRPASNEVPACWETGTLNFESLAGLVATIDYLTELGRRVSSSVSGVLNQREALVAAMRAIQAYEQSLAQELLPGLLKIPGVTIYGITDPERLGWRTPTVGMLLAGYTPYELAKALGERGIFTWNGNFYALNLTQRLGVESRGGLLRIGLAHYNALEEVHRLLQTLQDLAVRPLASVKTRAT
jgi:cysteine desulfurase family protein (TIGR01976 family)